MSTCTAVAPVGCTQVQAYYKYSSAQKYCDFEKGLSVQLK